MAARSNSTVGSYVTLQRGKTYNGMLVGAPGPALLGLGSIEPGGGFRADHYKTYGGECPENLMLYPGDIYVSLKGATKDGSMIGSVARVPPTVKCGRLTQDTVKLEFREPHPVLKQHIYWVLRTPQYRDYCAGRATGSAQVGLSREDFLSYPIPPVTAITKTLVGVLEAIEAKIELNRRMNETLKALVRAIFNSWFVDFDPIHAKAERRHIGFPKPIADLFPGSFEDSGLGRIPKGWRIVTLDTQVEAQKGLSYKGSGLVEAGIPMHNLNSIYEGGGYKFKGIKFYAGEYEERHFVRPGDLIVTNTEQGHDCRLIGYAAVVPKCFGSSGLFTHHLYRVRPLKDAYLTSQYLAFLFNSRAMHEEISGYGNGTTVNMLPADALQRPKIVMPPAPLVHAFDRLAVASFGRCEETVMQNHTLTQIRGALLPRLLSGELSVSQADKSVKEAI